MVAVFVIAASLLLMEKMLRLFDFVAVEGGPVSIVFKMLANLIPEYASLAIPLGLLLGILLAFRKLATSSELDVLRAVGMGYNRLLRVPYMLTIALAALNLLTAIVIHWNTARLGEAVAQRQRAKLPVPPDLLAHTSPLGWAHILLTGEYKWPKG